MDFLTPSGTSPPIPPIKTAVLAHYVAVSELFCRFGVVRHTDRTRPPAMGLYPLTPIIGVELGL